MPIALTRKFKAISVGEFKKSYLKGEAMPDDMVVCKDVVTLVEPLEDRRVRFTASSAEIDREGDSIAVDGWDLTPYLSCPMWLQWHDGTKPVGRGVEVGQTDGVLKATVEFMPFEVPIYGAEAEAMLQMYRGGFMHAVSVGFRPLQWEMAKERMNDDDWFPPVNFIRQELLEISCVTIPCLQSALVEPGERRGLIVPPAQPAPTPADDVALAHLAEIQRARTARQRRARLIEFA
jgi:hypothetical protein